MDKNILSIKVEARIEYIFEASQIQDEADRLFGPGTEVDDALMNKIAQRLANKSIDRAIELNTISSENFEFSFYQEHKIKHAQG